MTSGPRTARDRRRRPAATLLTLALSAACALLPTTRLATSALAVLVLPAVALAAPAPLDRATLMALLAQNRSGQARYVELRHVQGLDQPLRSSGTLNFVAPDRFVREQERPRYETMEVVGNTLRITRQDRTRSLPLDGTPEVAAIVEAVRGTLTGNAAVLDRYFESALRGSADDWTLTLTPRDARLAEQVRQLVIGGRQRDLRRVDVQLVGGDRSEMTIEPIAAAPAGSAAR